MLKLEKSSHATVKSQSSQKRKEMDMNTNTQTHQESLLAYDEKEDLV